MMMMMMLMGIVFNAVWGRSEYNTIENTTNAFPMVQPHKPEPRRDPGP